MIVLVFLYSRVEFEEAVADALDLVPPELTALMDNVVVLVEDDAPAEDPELLGVYEGVPLTERDLHWAAGALPDRITIFRNPIMAFCAEIDGEADECGAEGCECEPDADPEPRPFTEAAARARFEEILRDEISVTVIHEIAHHFGIDDERLHELGWA